MNDVIELLLNHRSIRKFKEETLPKEIVEQLVKAAQSASTSSYVQAYSIIGVTDEKKKQALRSISTQPYVEHNGHLFVFVVDYNRHARMSEQMDIDLTKYFGSTESLLVGTVDAALAAQNLAVAAESMDLGICYIGSLRNDMARVIDILELPDYVFPLFGMVVGYKADNGSMKPRLPLAEVYHENVYTVDNDAIKQYDEVVSQYYKERSGGDRGDQWSEQIVNFLNEKSREHVDGVVKGQGFLKQ